MKNRLSFKKNAHIASKILQWKLIKLINIEKGSDGVGRDFGYKNSKDETVLLPL